MNKILLFFLIINYFSDSSEKTVIQKTTNEILFKPLGQLIPELSWATVRIKLNITDMFKETVHLCRATNLMKKEYGRNEEQYGGKIPPSKINSVTAHLTISLTQDIEQMCTENTLMIGEIINVFNLDKIVKPLHIPELNKDDNNKETRSLTREVRQVVVGAILGVVGVITSLVSIFTSTELLKMSSSEDSQDELIDNNNNIITSLQTHESAIHRNEESIKQIKTHLKNLEEHLSIERRVNDVYINLFSLKVFGSITTQHLQRIQDGLYQLLKNKLSPKLVPLRKLEGVIEKLRRITSNRGYKLAIQSTSDIFMCDTSFVAYEHGQLVVLTHIPMYKTHNLMKLLSYQPTPVLLGNNSYQQIFIKPQNPIVAVNNDLTLYSTYTKEEIHHECKNIHNQFHCRNKNILKRTQESSIDCTLALYTKNKEKIKEKCSLEITTPQEVILQLNSTTFYTFSPKPTNIYISCMFEDQEKMEIKGFNLVTLKPGCKASIDDHIFTSGIEFEEEVKIKQNNLHLYLTDLVDIKDNEEKEFLEMLEEEQKIGTKPQDIIDVKKRYHLKLIEKKSKILKKIFGSTSIVTIIFIGILMTIIIRRCFLKRKPIKEGFVTLEKSPTSHPRIGIHLETRGERRQAQTTSSTNDEGISFRVNPPLPDDDWSDNADK